MEQITKSWQSQAKTIISMLHLCYWAVNAGQYRKKSGDKIKFWWDLTQSHFQGVSNNLWWTPAISMNCLHKNSYYSVTLFVNTRLSIIGWVSITCQRCAKVPNFTLYPPCTWSTFAHVRPIPARFLYMWPKLLQYLCPRLPCSCKISIYVACTLTVSVPTPANLSEQNPHRPRPHKVCPCHTCTVNFS